MSDDESLLGAYSSDVSAADAVVIATDSEDPLYSHGYALRVIVRATRDKALAALEKIDWAPDSSDWRAGKLKHCRRWILRGSTFITHRKPRNERLPMAQFNSASKTNLYSLMIDDDGEEIALIFHGVRRSDVETVLCNTMGLGGADYYVAHYTALERYFVLGPREALRLAAELGGEATNGRGRAARKQYLLRDLEVPIVVGERARRTAKITIYRLRGGATAQYKVELRLKGRSRDRMQFSESDVPKLDAALEHLIEAHGLTPVSKPARWEPVTANSWRRDGRLAVIGQSAYRGRAVDQERSRLAEACHTPCLAFLTGFRVGSLTSVYPKYIRNSDPSRSTPESLPSDAHPPRRHRAWRSLAGDIGRYEGYLSEVILDANQDPAPFIEALIEDQGEAVGVGMITYAPADGHADSWGSVTRLAAHHPVIDETQVLVVVVDFSCTLSIESAMFSPIGDSLTESVPGPLYPPYWQQSWGLPPWEKALGPLMAPTFSGWRETAETTGMRIVTITTDLRPAHGRGELLKTHRFRDGRVRSHVGDAGRYYAHLRYLVDSDVNGRPVKITMAKDEGEGLPGRVIWG